MRQWTEEDRKRQSELIKARQPWKRSTGPKTAAGKAASSGNAHKHGCRSASADALRAFVRDCRNFRKNAVTATLLYTKKHAIKNSAERTVIPPCPDWIGIMPKDDLPQTRKGKRQRCF